jgi:chromate reductase
MSKFNVLGLCGSLRGDSWNLKLLRNFLSVLDTNTYSTRLYGPLDLPLMNQDLEGKPLDKRILDFKSAVDEATIVVFGAPEYNASMSPVLKNAVDWGSRPPKDVWAGKVGVLLAASPGALGGARGLIQLRTVLAGLKIWVIPEQVQCPLAHQAFDESGNLTNPMVQKQMKNAAEGLGTFTKKFLGGSSV